MTGSHTRQRLTLSVSRAGLPRFNALFQRGVGTRAAAGSSVHDFLTCELGRRTERRLRRGRGRSSSG